MNNHLSLISHSMDQSMPFPSRTTPSLVDLEDVMHQAALHASLVNAPKAIQSHVLFDVADQLSLQRIQNQLNLVSSANKRYWI